MPIVDVDFDVAGVSAARLHEDAAGVNTDLGSDGAEGGVSEADIDKSGVSLVGFPFSFFFFWERGLRTYMRPIALRYG